MTKVELPIATPEIMLGINQDILMALFMVAITALIGATIYDCRASADEAAAKLEYIWASFSDLLIEEPVTELFNRTVNMLELKRK